MHKEFIIREEISNIYSILRSMKFEANNKTNRDNIIREIIGYGENDTISVEDVTSEKDIENGTVRLFVSIEQENFEIIYNFRDFIVREES